MKFKLRMTGQQHAALQAHLFPGDGNEAVSLALCGRYQGQDCHILMVHRIVVIPYEDCRIRTPDRVTWSTNQLDQLLVVAEKKGMALLKMHSHPGGLSRFSSVDDIADRELFSSVYAWLDDGLPHMSAIMLPDGKVIARVVDRKDGWHPVDTVSVAGDNLLFWHSNADLPLEGPEAFEEKNSQFFGEETYSRLRQLSAAVVGCSGTGSPLIEQLARLGIGNLKLVDPDVVKEKNLNRILNTTYQDAVDQRPKVTVLAEAIESIGLGTIVDPIMDSVINYDVMHRIAECDVLFGCMDSVEGRYYLNRLAVFYSIPYFDLGVRLDADGLGSVSNACGNVHYLQPDGSSLIGRGMVSMKAIAEEGMARRDPTEYERQKHEGYMRNVHVERPAVITINMLISSIAANEFIARLHPYRRVSSSDSAIRIFDFRENDHVCKPEEEPCSLLARYAGRGDISPFLEDPAPEIQNG